MRSGLFLPLVDQLADPALVARLAGEAEEVGWHGVFVWDTCAGGSRLSRSPSTPPPALSGLGTRDLQALRRILKSATTRK